jgi:hypothetical protein
LFVLFVEHWWKKGCWMVRMLSQISTATMDAATQPQGLGWAAEQSALERLNGSVQTAMLAMQQEQQVCLISTSTAPHLAHALSLENPKSPVSNFGNTVVELNGRVRAFLGAPGKRFGMIMSSVCKRLFVAPFGARGVCCLSPYARRLAGGLGVFQMVDLCMSPSVHRSSSARRISSVDSGKRL